MWHGSRWIVARGRPEVPGVRFYCLEIEQALQRKKSYSIGDSTVSQDSSETSNDTRAYVLDLAPGAAWSLVGTGQTQAWVDELARILELKSENGRVYPKIEFVHPFDPRDRLDKSVPRPFEFSDFENGWKVENFGFVRWWSRTGTDNIVCELRRARDKRTQVTTMLYTVLALFRYAIDLGGVPLHAALVERAGIGVTIAGRGGAGKSTCCRILSKHWSVLCDDLTLALPSNQLFFVAHPFPTWSECQSGSMNTWNAGSGTRLGALFFLKQGTSDEVVPLGQAEAAVEIYRSTTQVSGYMWGYLDEGAQRVMNQKMFRNACNMARSVPSFILRARLGGRFWSEMERVLGQSWEAAHGAT